MDLLNRIEEHMAVNRLTATQFGRRALRDPRFVFDLRSGRRLRPATIAKVEAYLGSAQLSLRFQ
jgi:2,4-dienoyl-CoA reductase-like NADH-dependent reductase (Old Yellow Enzyme family)